MEPGVSLKFVSWNHDAVEVGGGFEICLTHAELQNSESQTPDRSSRENFVVDTNTVGT
jgi:hypothetical protein